MSRVSPNREAAKERVRAKVAAEKALPARERLMNMLHAVRTHAESVALLDEFVAEALNQAADEVELSADEMERVLGRRLETSSVERGVANRLRRMAQTGGAK